MGHDVETFLRAAKTIFTSLPDMHPTNFGIAIAISK
jgi:hypothetical protein